MRSDRASGGTLLVGAVLLVVTMVLHPSGGSMERIQAIAGVIVGTHALAIVSLALLTLGCLGLVARLERTPFLARGGMVAFSFAAVAGMCAAVLNGMALPAAVRHYAAAEGATHDALGVVLGYNHFLNAGFARVFMVGVAVAVVLWAVAVVREGALPRWSGYLGLAGGLLALALVLAGVVSVDVHDFGLFAIGASVWTAIVGAQMWRESDS